jgi:hypothetical protein
VPAWLLSLCLSFSVFNLSFNLCLLSYIMTVLLSPLLLYILYQIPQLLSDPEHFSTLLYRTPQMLHTYGMLIRIFIHATDLLHLRRNPAYGSCLLKKVNIQMEFCINYSVRKCPALRADGHQLIILVISCAQAALGIEAENPQRGRAFAHRQSEDLKRKARPKATPLLKYWYISNDNPPLTQVTGELQIQ